MALDSMSRTPEKELLPKPNCFCSHSSPCVQEALVCKSNNTSAVPVVSIRFGGEVSVFKRRFMVNTCVWWIMSIGWCVSEVVTMWWRNYFVTFYVRCLRLLLTFNFQEHHLIPSRVCSYGKAAMMKTQRQNLGKKSAIEKSWWGSAVSAAVASF